MRIVTYNIRLGFQQGIPAIAEALREERPDVVAIQEVGLDWVMGPEGDSTAALAALLELPHYRFVKSITRGDAHYGHAILSKHPILHSQHVELPRDIDEPRTYLITKVSGPLGPIHFLSTHLSHITDRTLQGTVLLREALQLTAPCVVLGDLNATAEEEFITALCCDFEDADAEHQRPTFPAEAPEARIDYLLARGATWRDVVVGEDIAASDHRYVAATLDFTSSSS